jgi:hypothetical protein
VAYLYRTGIVPDNTHTRLDPQQVLLCHGGLCVSVIRRFTHSSSSREAWVLIGYAAKTIKTSALYIKLARDGLLVAIVSVSGSRMRVL